MARLLRSTLSHQRCQAWVYFRELDTDFDATIRTYLDNHSLLEASVTSISIQKYASPTASAFGYVFGLMAGLPAMAGSKEFLSAIGQLVGSAIISFDCAVDWHDDRRHKNFNPLPNEDSRIASRQYSVACINDAASRCFARLGPRATSGKILEGVASRMEQLALYQPMSCHTGNQNASKRFVYAYSDVCCAICCCYCCFAYTCKSCEDSDACAASKVGCGFGIGQACGEKLCR